MISIEKNEIAKYLRDYAIMSELIRNNPSITIEEMAKFADVATRTIERNIKKLKEREIIDRVGADKNGHWIAKI